MGNNSVPKFIFRLSRFPVYRGSVLGRFYCTSAECTVEISWWWAEEMPETCRVSWQNKFAKLVRLFVLLKRYEYMYLLHYSHFHKTCVRICDELQQFSEFIVFLLQWLMTFVVCWDKYIQVEENTINKSKEWNAKRLDFSIMLQINLAGYSGSVSSNGVIETDVKTETHTLMEYKQTEW